MKSVKTILLLGVELAILYFITRAVATRFIFPIANEPFWLEAIFLIIFIISSVVFILFSLSIVFSSNKFLREAAWMFLALSFAGIIYASFLFEMNLWILFLVLVLLFLLHLGITKLLATKKRRAA